MSTHQDAIKCEVDLLEKINEVDKMGQIVTQRINPKHTLNDLFRKGTIFIVMERLLFLFNAFSPLTHSLHVT